MALAAAISKDDFDSLDKSRQEFYRSEGDIYVLDVEEVDGWALDKPDDLKNALKSERNRNAAAKKALEALGDVDPKAAVEALARVAELEAKLKDAGKKPSDDAIAAAVKAATEKLSAELKQKSADHDGLISDLGSAARRDAVRAALRKVDAEDAYDIVLPHIERLTKTERDGTGFVVHVVDEKGQPRITRRPGSTDGMSVDELVEEMTKSDTFARVFSKPGAGGTRGRTSPGTAGSRARSASGSNDSQTSALSPMERLRAANEAISAGLSSEWSR